MDTSDIQGLDVSLRKFDINKMRDDSNVIIIGKRETGKKYLTNDLLKNFSVPEGILYLLLKILHQVHIRKQFHRHPFIHCMIHQLLPI